ncbi:hypothetical protein FGG08_005336, partial [Glutinoglossum americanum]
LHGIPGCGKAVLSSTIVEGVLHYCNHDPTAGATAAVVYFYFDFHDIEKQRHEKMIRSLITQLSQQRESASHALESLSSSCRNGGQQRAIDTLLATLQHMVQEFSETYITLDALGE